MKQFLNQRVIIKSSHSTLYAGVLSGFKENESKFCLTKLVIMDKEGNFVAAPKSRSTRWFSVDKFEMRPETLEDMK